MKLKLVFLIAILNYSIGRTQVCFNPSVDFNIAGLAPSVSTGDFNSDGKLDIAAMLGSQTGIISLGTGTGSFLPVTTFSTVGYAPY